MRELRPIGTSWTATALVVAVLLTVGGLTVGATSALAAVSGYDPDVVAPAWGVDDLPSTLDEPVAAVVSQPARGRSVGDVLAVTASGRVYRVGPSSAWTATVSPDGWTVVRYDDATSGIVAHDLRRGTTDELAQVDVHELSGPVDSSTGPVSYPSVWSPDGSTLVVLVKGFGDAGDAALLLEPGSGASRRVQLTGAAEHERDVWTVGWRDDATLVAVSDQAGDRTFPVTVTEVALDRIGRRVVASAEPPGPGQPYVLTPDGSALISTWNVYPMLRTVDLASGSYEDHECSPCSGALAYQWVNDHEVVATPAHAPSGLPLVAEAVDIWTGETRPLLALSPRLTGGEITFARDLLAAGPSHEPHTSMWWYRWYADWIAYGALGLGLVIALGWFVRRWRRSASAVLA